MDFKLNSKMILGIVVTGLILFVWLGYNSLVSKEEKATSAWAQVENVYQRRADLIPNLVATVKGYAAHENETFLAVTEARNNATSIKVENLSKDEIAKFQKAQDGLGQALGRLIAIGEAYPDLKASDNFRDLQAQFESSENRIAVERNKFNETVRAYNVATRRFPSNILASIFGFEMKGYFTAAEGAEVAPKVVF